MVYLCHPASRMEVVLVVVRRSWMVEWLMVVDQMEEHSLRRGYALVVVPKAAHTLLLLLLHTVPAVDH